MSAARKSSYKLTGMVTLLYRYRTSSSPSPLLQGYHREFSSSKLGYGGYNMINHQGLRFLNSSSSGSEADTGKPQFQKMNDTQPPAPPSPKPGISAWVKWLLGFVLSMLLPLKQKWESLRRLEGKVEIVVGDVEEVAEAVEKMATVAEKISTEVADQVPDNSMIKKAAVAVEHISNVAAEDAQFTQNFIHEVEDVKQDLQDLETMVEPVIDNIIKSDVEHPHMK